MMIDSVNVAWKVVRNTLVAGTVTLAACDGPPAFKLGTVEGLNGPQRVNLGASSTGGAPNLYCYFDPEKLADPKMLAEAKDCFTKPSELGSDLDHAAALVSSGGTAATGYGYVKLGDAAVKSAKNPAAAPSGGGSTTTTDVDLNVAAGATAALSAAQRTRTPGAGGAGANGGAATQTNIFRTGNVSGSNVDATLQNVIRPTTTVTVPAAPAAGW